MKKIALALAFAAVPAVVSAQVQTKPNTVVIEEYNARDQKLMDLEVTHRAELNDSLDRSLENMTDKETKVLVNIIKGNDKKRERITGDTSNTVEIKGNDKAAVKKYFNDSLKSEVYMPWGEPEARYEIEITE